MADKKLSLGQAIDNILTALENLDENARKTALAAVCSHLGIKLDSIETQTNASSPYQEAREPLVQPAVQADSTRRQKKIDIRSLKEEKKPNTSQQMACIVAYYLQELAPEGDRKETVSTKDIEKYFKQAGYKLPQKLNQVLVHGKNSGYFEAVGKAQYKLTPVGYNLVVHGMPSKKGT